MGMRHLDHLNKISGVEPIAIPKRPERIPVLNSLGHVTAMDLIQAKDMGADWCIIATDTGMHVQDGLQAVSTGFHILIEKPMATTASEAKRLQEMADECGSQVFIGCDLRFTKSLNAFKTFLDKLGYIHSVSIECRSYLPGWQPDRPYTESFRARESEGGVLLDLIHEIDYAGWIFGWPLAVIARLKNTGRLGIKEEDMADLFWEVPNGGSISLRLDYLSHPTRRYMRASGELGTLEWDGITDTVTLSAHKAVSWQETYPQMSSDVYREQIEACLKSTRLISDYRLATSSDGVKALAVCDSARRSSLTNTGEKVGY